MVVFWISAPIFGLITAILFGMAELGLLAGLLNILNYSVCKRLSNQKPVQVRSYRRLVMALSLLSVFTFVLAETVLSVASDPGKGQLFANQDCLRNFVGSGKDDGGAEAEAIQFTCTEANGTYVIHKTGNYSTKTGKVVCNDVGYYYNIGERLPYKRSMGKPVTRCNNGICAALAWQNNTDASDETDDLLPHKGVLYVSQNILRNFKKSEWEMMPTQISNVDLSKKLRRIGARAARMYAIGINEEGELRRRMLLGTKETACPFVEEEVDTTLVATWALAFSATVWGVSVVLFVGTLFLRKRTFFDMGNPMHWAKTARHDSARSYGELPTLRIGESGRDLIWITDFSKNERDIRT